MMNMGIMLDKFKFFQSSIEVSMEPASSDMQIVKTIQTKAMQTNTMTCVNMDFFFTIALLSFIYTVSGYIYYTTMV